MFTTPPRNRTRPALTEAELRARVQRRIDVAARLLNGEDDPGLDAEARALGIRPDDLDADRREMTLRLVETGERDVLGTGEQRSITLAAAAALREAEFRVDVARGPYMLTVRR